MFGSSRCRAAALRPGSAAARERGAIGGADRCGVDGGAGAAEGEEELVRNRRENGRQQRTAMLDQGDDNGPVRQPTDIGTGAVDRVDDPGAVGALGRARFVRFFGQPAVSGIEAGEALMQQFVAGEALSLVQCRSGPRNRPSARAPASRTAGSTSARSTA
jgi:hypothetical protein